MESDVLLPVTVTLKYLHVLKYSPLLVLYFLYFTPENYFVKLWETGFILAKDFWASIISQIP